MRIEVVTPPVNEPVSLDEAKAALKVDFTDEDDLIGTYITAAREHIEEVTGRALAEQTLRLVLDRFPCRYGSDYALPLPRPPLRTVESVKYLDGDGTEQTWDPSNYEVITDGTPGAIYAPGGWPAISPRPGSVRVTLTCGYGGDAEAAPERLLVAIRQLVRHWYDNRTPVVVGTIATSVPTMIDTLTQSVRFRYRLPQS